MTKAECEERLARYESGMTDEEMAKAEGCCAKTICSWRIRRGLMANTRLKDPRDLTAISIIEKRYQEVVRDEIHEIKVYREKLVELQSKLAVAEAERDRLIRAVNKHRKKLKEAMDTFEDDTDEH